MKKLSRFAASLVRFPARLYRERRGNVLMLMGFSVIPLTLAAGVAVDYARAGRLQTKLNAAADAAALAAVTAPMMLKDNDAARTAAIAMFKSQITGLPGLTFQDSDLTVSVTGNTAAVRTRTAVVTYEAKSANAFAGMVGLSQITIGGSATSVATAAPNIDFYVALDTSPSMALPTTTAGFNIMDSAVTCAFACHSNKIQNYVGSSIPSLILDNTHFAVVKGTGLGTRTINGNVATIIDSNGAYVYNNRTSGMNNLCKSGGKDICVYNTDGTFADSYWYALNQGVRLRVTDSRSAAQDLMSYAQNYASQNGTVYRAALYTFDHSTNLKTIATLTSNLASVSTSAGNVDLVTVNDQAGNGCPPTGCTGSNRYLFTSFKSILDNMSSVLPAHSGNGSRDPGDTPQAFLFMVTDGMSDEDIGSGRTRSAMRQAQIDTCNAIKGRGIQIAILYTEYTSASIQDDEPGQRAIANAAIPNIAPALTQCASPGLMYTVRTDESITAALQELFSKAVASARLLQ